MILQKKAVDYLKLLRKNKVILGIKYAENQFYYQNEFVNKKSMLFLENNVYFNYFL